MRNMIALIDMDGTVADYDAHMRVALDKLRSPHEPEVYDHSEGEPPWRAARRRLVSTQPGFWRNLPVIPLGMSIVSELKDAGFTLHVLTKGPSTKPVAWSEKIEWCREHLPDVQITITERKDLTYGRLLVDDWPPYLLPWLESRPRGVVIVPAQPWNKGVEQVDPSRIYRCDGSDMQRVRAIAQAVAARGDGEHVDVRDLPLSG